MSEKEELFYAQEHNSNYKWSTDCFKLRSRMTNVKTNMMGMYDTFESTACENDEESQKHILECNELIKRNKDIEEKPGYRNIFKLNVKEQTRIGKYSWKYENKE